MNNNVEINTKDCTFIDRDNNKVFKGDEIIKLDIGDNRKSYSDILINILYGDKDINSSAIDVIQFFVDHRNIPYKESLITKSIASNTGKSERTYNRALSDLILNGIVTKSNDRYKLATDIFNNINGNTRLLVIELNPENTKLTL